MSKFEALSTQLMFEQCLKISGIQSHNGDLVWVLYTYVTWKHLKPTLSK